MLWIIGTPIGNLGDLCSRTREVLESCDLILCEDTRRSGILLSHLDLKKPLKSYHKFNETEELDSILNILKEGRTLALLSDGGMPAISDPGQLLIAACREAGIEVSAVPGPCAAVHALVLSGFPSLPFQFHGFLSKKEQEKCRELIELMHYPGTSICYEAPHRIVKTLQTLSKIAPTLTLCLARELTKRFEECLIGTPEEILATPSLKEPKGEMVLVFKQHPFSTTYSTLPAVEHVHQLEETFGLSKKDAIKLAASLRQESKRELYQQCLNSINEIEAED